MLLHGLKYHYTICLGFIVCGKFWEDKVYLLLYVIEVLFFCNFKSSHNKFLKIVQVY